MILCIGEVLSKEAVERIRNELEQLPFKDGRETAGWHARTVKKNQQADVNDPGVQALRAEINHAISKHPLFQMAVRPRRVLPLRFSRYSDDMEYGFHVDDAVMDHPDGLLRTDVSFTLFLSDEDSYDGGELVTDTTSGDQSYKLPAGSMVVYPSSTLHRVAPVTRGERLAAIGWAQSQVRDPAQREVLFDLDTARRQIFNEHGKTEQFDSVSKSLANLLRMWSEV